MACHNVSQSAPVLRSERRSGIPSLPRYIISLPLGVSTALRMFSSLPFSALM